MIHLMSPPADLANLPEILEIVIEKQIVPQHVESFIILRMLSNYIYEISIV